MSLWLPSCISGLLAGWVHSELRLHGAKSRAGAPASCAPSSPPSHLQPPLFPCTLANNSPLTAIPSSSSGAPRFQSSPCCFPRFFPHLSLRKASLPAGPRLQELESFGTWHRLRLSFSAEAAGSPALTGAFPWQQAGEGRAQALDRLARHWQALGCQ